MLVLGLLVSIGVPLFAGLPWLLAADREAGPGHWPIATGYGYAFGLLVIVAGMHVLALANIRIGFLTSLAFPVVVGAIGWWRARRIVPPLRDSLGAARANWRETSRTTRIVCRVLLALLVVRMITLAVELLSRPIFPWEAVSNTASKARVWYETGTLAAFVTPLAMLQGVGFHTDADPGAQSLPPLLLVWTADAIGQWQEGAVTFAWWALGIAIGLALYGHLRSSGAGLALSLAFTYLLLSLPLVDMHIVLSGAPQWIGSVGIGLASLALMCWLVHPTRKLLACMLIGSALALSGLSSTWPWFAAFGIAAVIQRSPRLAVRLAVGTPILVAIALLALMQTPLSVAGMTVLVRLATDWNETPESLILLDNWHLLFGVLLLTVVAGWRQIFSPEWLARTWLVVAGLGLMIVKGLLSLPPYWFGGLRDFSYTALQLAPMMVLWIALVAHRLATAGRQPVPATAGT